jgi:hypothetical protein
MAKFYDELDDFLKDFISKQHIFFNASAPVEGRINISPKGLDTFRILNNKRVAYLDLTGAENESGAHLAENGRFTLMFCSFDEKPLILRIYGNGRAVRPRDSEWADLHTHFPVIEGERQIIVLDIESLMTSCGFGVPLFEFRAVRTMLPEFACNMGETKMDEYRKKNNQKSIDGMPTYYLSDSDTQGK